MKSVWVLMGPPGVGKSTVVSRVVLRLKSAALTVGGCSTPERRVRGERVGFDVVDLTEGTSGELSSVSARLGPRVGKYRVNLENLSKVGAAGLARAASRSDVIVIDEVGPMELVSPEFRRAVGACLDSGKPMLVVAHERMDDDLLVKIRTEAHKVVEVTTENRDEVADEVSEELLRAARGA